MTIKDANLLAEFRVAGRCEYCGKFCRQREGHHLWSTGAGRLDIRINLIALGASKPFPLCPCHGEIHAGLIGHESVLAVVAAREKVLQHHIEHVIERFLRRVPNRPIAGHLEAALEELDGGARVLAKKILFQAGVLAA